MLLISVNMSLSFNWVQLWIVIALKRVKKTNNVLFCLKLCYVYSGGQSYTLYVWWSVGHFVYLVLLLKSL